MHTAAILGQSAGASNASSGGGAFFFIQAGVIVIGMVVHMVLDRHGDRRTKPRLIELALLWVIVGVGAWAIVAGLGHIGPTSNSLAKQIGYRQSMFQWEIGWADIAIGVLGVGCVWRRDGWLDAAVIALAVSYGGDAIGHIMQYSAHNNHAGSNVWAIPSDILQPIAAVLLLILYRRTRAAVPNASADRQ